MQQLIESETPDLDSQFGDAKETVTNIAKLMMGEEIEETEAEPEAEQQQAQPEGDDEGEPEQAESADPGSLKELAEKLKIDVKDLYKVKIAMPEGAEPFTIGQLKDLAQKNVDWTEKEHSLEVDRQRIKNDEMQTRQELAQVLQSVPKHLLSPEVIQKARLQWQEYNQTEYKQTLARIPDYDTKHESLMELAKEYGITAAEYESVPDHRFRALLNDLSELRGKYANANAMAKEIKAKPKGLPAQRKGKEPPQLAHAKRVRQADTEEKRIMAISELIKG